MPDRAPLFASGHGLSYTAFDVSSDGDAEVHDGIQRAPVRVTSTSARDDGMVVQLCARDEYASVVHLVRLLLGFRRLALAAGESADLVLEAPLKRLCCTLPDGRRGREAGEVTLMTRLSRKNIRCTATVLVPAVSGGMPR